MINFNIKHVSKNLADELQHKIDNKTKPLGSLGKLENLALKIGCIQDTLSPELQKPTMLVFAGDHGIAKSGVCIYPQEVTYQMILNFLNGGAAINVFTTQNNIDLKVIDAGVAFDFENSHPNFINQKIAKGTKNFLFEPAMTEEQCLEAIKRGANIAKNLHEQGCNIVGFGEMGIGNTSPSTMLLSILCDIPINECVGRGAGLDNSGLEKKKNILKKALENADTPDKNDPLNIMRIFGGFEHAMMAGTMLQAAELGMILMIDGFNVTSALLFAAKICPAILDYCIFAHKSDEHGHIIMLEHLNADPLVQLNMRLGEGTGVAVAYPLIKSAVLFLNNMASFKSANVSNEHVNV